MMSKNQVPLNKTRTDRKNVCKRQAFVVKTVVLGLLALIGALLLSAVLM